jgi:hypothetical protein
MNYGCYYDDGNAVVVVVAADGNDGNDGSGRKSHLGIGDVSNCLHC